MARAGSLKAVEAVTELRHALNFPARKMDSDRKARPDSKRVEFGLHRSRIKRCGVDDRCGANRFEGFSLRPGRAGEQSATFSAIREVQEGFDSKGRSLSRSNSADSAKPRECRLRHSRSGLGLVDGPLILPPERLHFLG
jgi:hypothetical protein